MHTILQFRLSLGLPLTFSVPSDRHFFVHLRLKTASLISSSLVELVVITILWLFYLGVWQISGFVAHR